MKPFVALLVLFSFALPLHVVMQDTTPKPTGSWTGERHCVDKPTRRPETWTFDGTILLTGEAGIYGVNDDWETSRVVAPLNFGQINTNIVGGALSPDGRWYASPFGDRELTQSNNVYTTVREIRVYSTSAEDREYIVILAPVIEGIPAGFYVQIHWQDSQWFLYANGDGDILINPFTQETQFLEGYHFHDVFDPLDYYQRPHLAPDFTLAVSTEYMSSDPQWGLYAVPAKDLFSAEPLIQLDLAETAIVAWRPDAHIFAAEQEVESGRQLVFVNRSGVVDEVVFHLPEGERVGNNNTAWSLNGRYFAFITFKDLGSEYGVYDYWGSPNTLYIADTQEQVVIDTCLSTGVGLAWSPDSTQLAFLAPGDGIEPVFVMDVENLNAYAVANHLVEAIGVAENYRPNNVIGWRISD
jgi:hypothetical protein